MDELLVIAIVVVLILLNAFFVAAEFAIVGVTKMDVQRAVKDGKPGAKLVQWFVDDPLHQDRFIATSQLGITAASLALGMYGEHKLAVWIAGWLEGWGAERWIAAHSAASALAITVLTYFHIVVGEMVPKALALQNPGGVARRVAVVMRGTQLVFYPIIIGLNGIGNLILRLLGIERAVGTEHYRSPEELAYIVRESEEGGELRKKPADVVAELLDFGNLTAAEVMVPRVHVTWLCRDMDIEDLRDVVENAPHTRYPVYEDSLDNVVGMLHIRDVLRWAQAGTPFDQTQLRAVPHVPLTATTNDVLAAMRDTGVQMVVVMGEQGGTKGIVTLEDLFEEVVGDITERPGEEPTVAVDEDGFARAAGVVRIDEVGEALGVVLEHEEVDTVSGLVLALLGRRPEVGDVVEYDDVRFEVTEVRGNGVGSCRASLMKPPVSE